MDKRRLLEGCELVCAIFSQLASHPAILLCELAVARRMLPVGVPMSIAAFGCLLQDLRSSGLTICGPVQTVGCRVHFVGCRPLRCRRF
jgi:hypothetical protein